MIGYGGTLSGGLQRIINKLTIGGTLTYYDKRKGKMQKMYAEPLAFDIETTNERERKRAYMWCWQLGTSKGAVIGRTWNEFALAISMLSRLPYKVTLYVHNLSYEYQYIKTILPLADTLIIRGRKILSTWYKNIEFRCSYLLSNMSLRKWLAKWNVPAQKTELEYGKKRYPWTRITPEEQEYIINDVVGLCQALKAEMEYNNDDLRSVPKTSTGYVRREARRATKKLGLEALLPGVDLTLQLQEAMRGGNTHANRFKAGQILEGVQSADMSSAYPAVMVEELFPVTPFERADRLASGKAQLFRVELSNLRLRHYMEPCPYITAAMCKRGLYNPYMYNGRVLGAYHATFVVTDVDWRIICRQYVWDDITISDIWQADYGELPTPITDLVIDWFAKKTLLKGVDEYAYLKSKGLLNSWYGMCVQSPTRQEYMEYRPDSDTCMTVPVYRDAAVQIAEFNESSAVMPYQWGVWVTAYCRKRLQQAIDLVGDDFVYCDTDSVKYIGKHDVTLLLAFNWHYAAPIKDGTLVKIGVWEPEHTADKFITWGAKKYCAQFGRSLELTVAGVEKIQGARLLRRAGGIEKFKPGFIFRGCGGLAAWYNDTKEGFAQYPGGQVLITSNTYLQTVDYQLNITDNFKKILDQAGESLLNANI